MTNTPKTHAEVAKAIVDEFFRKPLKNDSPTLTERITTALREARFNARRECEKELAAIGLKVALQDEGVTETTFAECKTGHILDDDGNVRRVLEWSHNPLTNRIHAEIDVTQGEKP